MITSDFDRTAMPFRSSMDETGLEESSVDFHGDRGR